jgi:hypothetical protein
VPAVQTACSSRSLATSKLSASFSSVAGASTPPGVVPLRRCDVWRACLHACARVPQTHAGTRACCSRVRARHDSGWVCVTICVTCFQSCLPMSATDHTACTAPAPGWPEHK